MVVFVRVMLYGQGNCPMIRMCVQMSNIASKKSENPLTCHSRELRESRRVIASKTGFPPARE